MNPTGNPGCPGRKRLLASSAGALVLAVALGVPGLAQAQAPFGKVEQAADALITALATRDEAALAAVLGKGWRQLLGLQDIDVENRFTFLE